MSVYLATDDKPAAQLATTTGWGDVGEWIESANAPELSHLFHHGWNEPASAIRDELAKAIEASSPPPSVASTLDRLAELLEGVEDDSPVVVTDGTQDESDASDD